jgi:hypothetical protein
MAVKTYRFRGAAAPLLENLNARVASTVAASAFTGGRVLDLTVEETAADDLKEAMAALGHEFLSENPAGPPSDDFIPVGGGADDKRVKVSADDTTPGFLEEKVVPGGDIAIDVQNPGANELLRITANIGTIFSADAINATVMLTTSLLTFQNAFQGESPDHVAPATDGDYLCFFSTDMRTTNNKVVSEIALGKNSTTAALAGSQHNFTGVQTGFSGSVLRVNGLLVTDKIYGIYRKVSGNGSVELYNRNLYMFRVA